MGIPPGNSPVGGVDPNTLAVCCARLQRFDVKQLCSTCVGHVAGVNVSVGEIPQDPTIDRTQTNITSLSALYSVINTINQPAHLRC
jgi:hypothetical protein